MVNRQTFRFARVHPNTGNPPFPSNLNNRITSGNLRQRGSLNLREQARNIVRNQNYNGDGYYYFTYVTEIVEDDIELDNQGNDQQIQVELRRTQRVAYFDGGGYIFETNEDINDDRLAGFILDKAPVGASEFTVYDEIDQQYLRQRYASATEVRKISFENIGDNNPSNPIETEIDQLGQEAESAKFSTGHYHNNLNQSQLVTSFASRCDIDSFSVVKSNSNRTVIYDGNGSVATSFPENAQPSQEVAPILNDTYDVLDYLTP